MTIVATAGLVAAGAPLQFLVRADPAPAAELTVAVTITSAGCTLTHAPTPVTIPAGRNEAPLTVTTRSDAVAGADECTVTAAIPAGEGYGVSAAATSARVTLKQPVVTITADSLSVTAGNPVLFTLNAAPPPASALPVTVSLSKTGSSPIGPRRQTVTIPNSGTAPLEENPAEPHDTVTVTVEDGSGYTVGTPSTATVNVTDNDALGTPVPEVTIAGSGLYNPRKEGTTLRFSLTAAPPPEAELLVNLRWGWLSPRFLSDPPPSTVKIPISGTARFELETDDDLFDDYYPSTENTVNVIVEAGSGYRVGSRNSVGWSIQDDDDYLVSVAAVASPVQEGDDASFRLTVTPAAPYDLAVVLNWSTVSVALAAGSYRDLPETFAIAAGSSTATVTVATLDDEQQEGVYRTGIVSLMVLFGGGYSIGDDIQSRIGTVIVEDDD
ncbi:MAG: hypothetical protein OXP69_24765 [Spirochaetaceae bacterium]|nr:hypothetical protein [Spirochaetaceae bacterium]